MADLIITNQDELPGPDGEAPYVLFVNETTYGNTRFLRTNVLSARPDLKKLSWSGFSGQGPSLTSEAGHRPNQGPPNDEQPTNP